MEPRWLEVARADKDLKEEPGTVNNPAVVKMFAEAGHAWVKTDSTAWCAAAVNAWLSRAGIKGTGKLDARSFLKWGVALDKPLPGCIVVFWRGSRKGWKGHVALYLGETKTHIRVWGGNQSNRVCESLYAKERLLGYRWPEGISPEKPAEAPPKPETPAGVSGRTGHEHPAHEAPMAPDAVMTPEPPPNPVAERVKAARQARAAVAKALGEHWREGDDDA